MRLWDVTPARNEPNVGVLEELRQALKQPLYLHRARECWWSTRQTVCLENQPWDPAAEEVVSPKDQRPSALAIQSAHFDAQAYKTVLQLAGQSSPLEIEL